MVILIDMDDTMEHLLAAWLDVANKRYGRNVQCDDVVSFDVSAAYPGLTKRQIYDIIIEPGFWANVKPMDHASEVIENLIKQGHEVFIVTASDYEAVTEKMDSVLFKYYPFISWDQVILTRRKQLLKADIMIDDGVHNLEGGDYVKILVDAPYNRAYDAEAAGMIRVHDWYEIEKVLGSVINQIDPKADLSE